MALIESALSLSIVYLLSAHDHIADQKKAVYLAFESEYAWNLNNLLVMLNPESGPICHKHGNSASRGLQQAVQLGFDAVSFRSMENIVYLNGQYLPLSQATVNVEDRGFMFADGVYEVVRYYNGKPLAMDLHLARLKRSLEMTRIKLPEPRVRLDQITDELLKRNKTPDASVYWQVTRGVAPRKHSFPKGKVEPTVLAIAYPQPAMNANAKVACLRAITLEDDRWMHCSIKSVALLPNVLNCQAAVDAGADEAVLHRDGVVTEGTARSIFALENGELITHPTDGRILESITRVIFMEIARQLGCVIREEYFDLDRLKAAAEVIAVGTTTEIASIIELDGVAVGGGVAGSVATQFAAKYRQRVSEECGTAPE